MNSITLLEMDDSKYNERKLQYFKEEGHWLIYFGILLSLAFLGYTYFQYFKLSKLVRYCLTYLSN